MPAVVAAKFRRVRWCGSQNVDVRTPRGVALTPELAGETPGLGLAFGLVGVGVQQPNEPAEGRVTLFSPIGYFARVEGSVVLGSGGLDGV